MTDMPSMNPIAAMTEHQRIALAFPCEEAEQTADSRFYWTVGDWSLCLTMNVGFE